MDQKELPSDEKGGTDSEGNQKRGFNFWSPYFWIGFLGWFAINALVWLVILDGDYMYGLCSFPVNLIVLAIFFVWKAKRQVAWGILAAFAANFLISLAAGVALNGVCLVPFFASSLYFW